MPDSHPAEHDVFCRCNVCSIHRGRSYVYEFAKVSDNDDSKSGLRSSQQTNNLRQYID